MPARLRRALTNPRGVGYSQQCLLARGSALKRAVEALLDPQVRRKGRLPLGDNENMTGGLPHAACLVFD